MLRISSLRSAFLTRVLCVHLLSKMLACLELLASCFVFIAQLQVYKYTSKRLELLASTRFYQVFRLVLLASCFVFIARLQVYKYTSKRLELLASTRFYPTI